VGEDGAGGSASVPCFMIKGRECGAFSTLHIDPLPSRLEITYVIWKHPGHLTSMKKELGSGTTFLSLWVRASTSAGRLRRSTARAWELVRVLLVLEHLARHGRWMGRWLGVSRVDANRGVQLSPRYRRGPMCRGAEEYSRPSD
jgi:hypothetical protein